MHNLSQHRYFKWLPAFVGFLLYLLSVGHGFVLDDNLVITRNYYVQKGIAGIPEILSTNYAHGHQGQGFNDGLYRPLSLVTFAIEKSFFGLSPAVSHFLQSLFYGLLLVTLMAWLSSLFPNASWVWWSVMLFAVHPIHTEVVANLKSRDEIFALLFFALAARQFQKWLQNGNLKNGLSSLLLLTLSLFSKESAITFLAIFPLMLWFQNQANKKQWLQLLWLLVPTLIFLGARYLVLQNMGEVDSGVTGLLQNALTSTSSFSERLGTAASIQWFYLLKLFIPVALASDYSYNAIPIRSLLDLESILGFMIGGTILILGFVLAKRKHPSGFGIITYFITLSVVANIFILIGAMAAERFLFTPSLGWSIALSAGIHDLLKNDRVKQTILIGIACVLSLLTINRIPDWKDEFTLFTTDVIHVPNSARAHYNAGTASNNLAKTEAINAVKLRNRAIEHFQKAIEIWPDYQDAYNNLGVTLMDANRLDDAYNVYSKLITRFPEYAKGRYNLGYTCYLLQRYNEAEQILEQYIATSKNADALFLVAECEGYQNKFDEAINHLQELVEIEPNKARAYLKLGLAYGIIGDAGKAEVIFQKGIQNSPKEAELYVNLSLVYLNSNRQAEAYDLLQQALVINPNHQRAKVLLNELSSVNAQNFGR